MAGGLAVQVDLQVHVGEEPPARLRRQGRGDPVGRIGEADQAHQVARALPRHHLAVRGEPHPAVARPVAGQDDAVEGGDVPASPSVERVVRLRLRARREGLVRQLGDGGGVRGGQQPGPQGQHGAAPGVEHGLDELDGPARTQGARDHLELARPERAQDVVGEPSHPQPGSGLVRSHLVQQQARDGGHVHLLFPPCALGVHGGAHAGGADAVGVHGGLAEADVEGQGIVGDGGRGGGGDVGHGPKSARTTTTAGDVPAGMSPAVVVRTEPGFSGA